MDFLTSLPTSDGMSMILVVVDRFSKMIRLIPMTDGTDVGKVATAFFDNIVKIHGLPRTIVSDRDPRFQSEFWS